MTTTEKYTVRVTLFGPLTLENHLGKAVGTNAQPWLLLKYLLSHPGRDIPQTELDQALAAKGGENAARVRLNRLREALAPLGLDGKGGLVQSAQGTYRLNPRYTIRTDAQEIAGLLAQGRKAEALALYAGPFLAGTPGPWAARLRLDHQRAFLALAQEILGGTDAHLLPLLARQAQAMAPEYTALHRDIRAALGDQPDPVPRPAPGGYDILSKLIIQEGQVYAVAAHSGQRPLQYIRRAEPAWTAAFQENGLRGLLTAVAREIHRGNLRTRADSKLTRALRKALHTLGLEEFQAMEEEEAVRRLVQLAEEALG